MIFNAMGYGTQLASWLKLASQQVYLQYRINSKFGEATVIYVCTVALYVYKSAWNTVYSIRIFEEPSDTTNLVQKLHVHRKEKECL